jgi:hypothetical protein
MITSGSASELAMIASWPLPWIPAQWIRMRFRGGERWSAHSRRIMSHPTYLALHRWATLAYPDYPGEWSLLAAALVSHIGLVASGEWSAEDLHCRVRATLYWWSRDDRRRAGGSRRMQTRAGVRDRLQPPGVFMGLPDVSPPPLSPTRETCVADWLMAAIGQGWLTDPARAVLTEGLELAADFVASRSVGGGLASLAAAAPTSTTCYTHRITYVLGHLPRPARDAIRCFVLGPTERTGVGGPSNSLAVWATSGRDPASVPARLVAVWRYHAAMLDPDIAAVASAQREPRDRLRRYAVRPELVSGERIGDLLSQDPGLAVLVGTRRR